MRFQRLALLGILSISACGYDASLPDWTGRVDTLANGAVRIINPSTGIWDSVSAWRIEADLELGGSASDGPAAFGFIQDIDLDEGGRLYVLDAQAAEVRIFDADGRFVRAIGRAGDGPGEFRQPAGIRSVRGGGVWVADPLVDRYTLFDSVGLPIRIASPGIRPASWYLIFPWKGTVTRGGEVIDHTSTPRGTRLLRFSSSSGGVAVDTFDAPTTTVAEFLLVDSNGQTRASMPVPFSPETIRYIDAQGGLWFGTNDQYRIVLRRLIGDTIRIIERAYEPVPITDGEVQIALKPAETFLKNGGRLDGPAPPTFKPAYRWFVVDDHGYLWVSLYMRDPDDGQYLEVFDPGGRLLGRVRVAFRFDPAVLPVIKGASFLAVGRDELDAQYVIRGRIAGRQ